MTCYVVVDVGFVGVAVGVLGLVVGPVVGTVGCAVVPVAVDQLVVHFEKSWYC